MPETRARDLANLAGAGATSSTVAYHETARGFTLPAGTGNANQVISSDGDGTTQWKTTLSAPEITSVTSTKGINRYESATDNGGGTFTVTGTNFGSQTGELTATISSDSSGVTNTVGDISCSSVSGTGGTTAVFTITGAESGFTAWTASLSSSSIYVKVTKQGLPSNIVALSGGVNTLSGDPTITVSGTASTTTVSTSSLGSYGGQVAGGGDDSNTKLLLNFDRTGGTDIEDSSNTGNDGHKITASGHATIKSSPFGDGKSAFFFDGSNDQISIANSADFQINSSGGSGTIEMWINPTTLQSYDILFIRYGSSGNYDHYCTLDTNGAIIWWRYDSSNNLIGTVTCPNGTIVINKWQHCAFTMSGTTQKVYVDGKEKASTTLSASTNHTADAPLVFGLQGSYAYSGFMDEIRVIKGTDGTNGAIYTGDYTVPTSRLTAITNTKLLIHSNSAGTFTPTNGVVRASETTARNSTNATNWDSKAYYYHTTQRDYLTAESGSLNIGNKKFTLEGWFKFDTSAFSWSTIYKMGGTSADDGSDTGVSILFGSSADGNLAFEFNNAGTYQTFTPSGFSGTSAQPWYHIVLERQSEGSTDGHLWVNGTKLSNITLPTSIDNPSTNNVNVGKVSGDFSNNDVNFFIDDLHLVVGSNVYGNSSGTITPPTSKITPVADTKFLYGLNNTTFADSSTSNHNITPTGSFHSQNHGGIAPAMAWPASQKKTGSAGIYLDGNGDYLTIASGPDFNGSAFTYEWWMYPEKIDSNNQVLFDARDGSNSNNHRCYLSPNGSGCKIIHYSGSSASITYDGIVIPLYAWSHIALASDGTNMRCYVNGKYNGVGTKPYWDNGNGVNIIFGNLHSDTGGSTNAFKGYFDQIRIRSGAIMTGTATTEWGNVFTQPTQIYGAYRSQNVGTITITGVAGDGGGDVAFTDDHSASSKTQINETNVGLTFTDGGAGNDTATITGTLKNITGTENAKFAVKATANEDAERTTIVGGTNFLGITQNTPVAPVLFNARRYVGTGASRDINGFGFAPDLVWTKTRDVAYDHVLFDSVRGATKWISPSYSDGDNAEATSANSLTAFNQDGFSLGIDSNEYSNSNNKPYIAWGWKAGGAPVSITSGLTGASSVTQSASSTTGFSITKYTGASSGSIEFPHNLGGIPEWILIKKLDGTGSWLTYHKDLGAGYNIFLDINSARTGSTPNGYFGTQTSTNIVLTAGGSGNSLFGGGDYICYAWKAVSGVSELGTYTVSSSDESALSKTVTLSDSNLTPKLIILKSIQAGSWYMFDTYRGFGTDNSGTGAVGYLKADDSATEATPTSTQNYIYDVTAGSFKVRGDVVGLNHTNSANMIYMAFA